MFFSTALMLSGCETPTEPARPAQSPAAQVCGMSGQTLAALATARGKVLGVGYRSTFAQDDTCYSFVAINQFNSLTTEIGTMTDVVEPTLGQFDFHEADAVAQTAMYPKLDFQIHSLIWDPVDQPGWGIVPASIRELAPAERHQAMVDLVTNVIRHFAGRSSMATVVNEAFDQMGNLQHNAWWETTQSDQYVVDAFRAARLADPKMLLFYNDHSAETHSDKSNAIYALVKKLHDMRLIDGIGFQGHLLGGKDQQPSESDMASNLQRFADLGLLIRFTELDVRIPVQNGVAAEADLERQKQVYKTMARLCVRQPQCTGLTLWGFTDKRSWITDYPDTFSGYGAATPTTSSYARKPAWEGIAEALAEG